MDYQRKPRRPIPAPPEKELLTAPEGAHDLGIGLTRLAELEKADPDFPRAIWLGPRSKRYVRAELRAYALRKRQKAAA